MNAEPTVIETAVVETTSSYRALRVPIKSNRIQFCRIPARLSAGETTAIVQIVDASEFGIGLISPIEIGCGTSVSLTLLSASGEFAVTGEIRYCREVPGDEPFFRLGIQIDPLKGDPATRWIAVLEEVRLMSLDRLGVAEAV